MEFRRKRTHKMVIVIERKSLNKQVTSHTPTVWSSTRRNPKETRLLAYSTHRGRFVPICQNQKASFYDIRQHIPESFRNISSGLLIQFLSFQKGVKILDIDSQNRSGIAKSLQESAKTNVTSCVINGMSWSWRHIPTPRWYLCRTIRTVFRCKANTLLIVPADLDHDLKMKLKNSWIFWARWWKELASGPKSKQAPNQ